MAFLFYGNNKRQKLNLHGAVFIIVPNHFTANSFFVLLKFELQKTKQQPIVIFLLTI